MPGNQRPTAIIGMGATGLSCVRHFAARGLPCVVMDTRPAPPAEAELRNNWPDIPCFTGGLNAAALAGADEVIVSPGLALDLPELHDAIAAGARVVGDIDVFMRSATAPVVGITGSNGKSTVTELAGVLVEAAGRRAAVGGNLGPPALDLLDGETVDYYVLELSSFQLERAGKLGLAVAVLLNIEADHLDRYADMEAYARAKAHIFEGSGCAVVNLDDHRAQALSRHCTRRIGFSLQEDGPAELGIVRHAGDAHLAVNGEALLPVAELRLAGRHNVANVLAALAIVHALDLPLRSAPVADALRNFEGLPHRCRSVGRACGAEWFDDSKGTNVSAACAAVAGIFAGRGGVLIAGGDGKGADFAPLAGAVRGRVHDVILIGRDAGRIAAVLDTTVNVHRAASLEDAVELAAALAGEDEAVLLSPACASFDMFDDYRHRGRVFTAAVRGLAG
ncbi:MAG: UDP-N-acetylmuramoyl-L-alanine--D-glutamate ligase [Gammaproteobacteria bacterium]|nr:UDP-N-acetylmuramoyl-L-alanine--D-glutamate ligase [Gammaproteobacteria bacterium]